MDEGIIGFKQIIFFKHKQMFQFFSLNLRLE
jgi:hypothetical protein